MQRALKAENPPTCPKSASPLRFGILGAARVGLHGIFNPAKSHPEVVISAVACRDKTRGEKYAQTYGIERVYAGPEAYQDLVNDPTLDVVYITLPNSLHFEWTMRALTANKHVLVEKPIADSADEARKIFALAAQKNLVVLEATHTTFHPATQRVKAIIDSGELGKVKSLVGEFAVPSLLSSLFFLKDDIRFKYDLGGGSTMDLGVYPLVVIRYLTGCESEPVEVTRATAWGMPSDPSRVDRGMHATFALPSSITAESFVDFAMPGWGPFGLIPRMPKLSLFIELEGGTIEYWNYLRPGSFNSIKVQHRNGAIHTEKVYQHADGSGEAFWTSYRYQLEAFVDKVKGRTPQSWTDPQTTISQMECIERIYEQAKMPARITSSYELSSESTTEGTI